MSDECERVFSTSKLTITSQMHRLLDEKVGQLVFIKCLLRASVVMEDSGDLGDSGVGTGLDGAGPEQPIPEGLGILCK